MSRETLGYVKLEWTCPKCGSRNPGPEKTCLSCGAPQPEDVQFEKAAAQELIQDQAEIEQAKAGPDVHCAFCGARNPAGSTECTQCGADLVHGTKRASGQVIGAFQAAPILQVACPNCGTNNPETALKCASCGASLGKTPQADSRTAPKAEPVKKSPIAKYGLWITLALIGLCIVAGIILLVRPSEAQNAVVDGVKWVTVVNIEALEPVSREDWRADLPSEAEVGSCTEKVHHVQEQPAPNANQVCGTPYQVDTGSGFAEVVQDCQYEVLEEWCQYTVMEWQQVDQARLEGTDFTPQYAEPIINQDQRLGDQDVTYTVVFETPEGIQTYTTTSLEHFRQFQLGSKWILNLNALGGVVSVEPKP